MTMMMSANFSLAVVNPAVTGNPTSVLYTGVDGGNTLNLIIGNNFGWDLTIGGSSLGQYLVVQFPSNIMDADGAAHVSVASPWTVGSVAAPATINLLPPAGGMTLPNGGTITITLQDVQPSATGAGVIAVSYQFDDISSDDLSASASVSSLAPPNPNNPSLIGDNDALRLTTYVNGGPLSNPIMVSASAQPVNGDTAVDNQLHFNLLFQQATSPQAGLQSDGSGLVDGWNPAHPPSIRVFFPYSTAGQLPAPLDLTDALKTGEPNYNPWTSAWNIQASLDPTNPDITSDAFWQIAKDPLATVVPVWLITPTGANTNLFTAVESSSSEPGPFLNFYLQAIVSALPIDPENPETILYVQWNDFPGFNDGIVAYPLQKTTLAINSFDVKVQRRPDGPELVATWSTTGAMHCEISGDLEQLGMNTGSTPYTRRITSDDPMLSAYTLKATGTDGVTQVTRQRVVRWTVTSALSGASIESAYGLMTTADGKTVLVLGGPNSDQLGLFFCDGETLQAQSLTPMLADGKSIFGLAVTPDGSALYAMTYSPYSVYGYTLPALNPTPGSGATFANTGDTGQLIAVSYDSTVVVQAPMTLGDATTFEMVVLSANTLTPAAASVSLPQGLTAMAVGPQTGNYYLAAGTALIVLEPDTYRQASASPVALGQPATWVTVPANEASVYVTIFTASSETDYSAALARIDPDSGAITARLNTTIALVFGVSVGGLAGSPDGATLFLCGFDLKASTQAAAISRVNAYDGMTLEELPWSPISFGGLFPLQIVMSPDGSRLYATVVTVIDNPPPATLVAVDPDFA